MGSLTERHQRQVFCNADCSEMIDYAEDCECPHLQKMRDKLAHYEDLEEQGFILKLPYKLGQEIYWISDEDEEGNKGLCVRGGSYIKAISFCESEIRVTSGDGTWDVPNQSRWCYLSKSEAEKALAEMKG